MSKSAYFMPYFSFLNEQADIAPAALFMSGSEAALLIFAAVILLWGIVQPGISREKSANRKWRMGAVFSVLAVALTLGLPILPGAGSGIPALAASVVQFAGFLSFEVFFLLILLKRRFPVWALKQFLPLPLLALAAALLPLSGRIGAPLALICFSGALCVLCLLLLAFSAKTGQRKLFCFGGFICLFLGIAFVLPSGPGAFFWTVALLAYIFLESGFSSESEKGFSLFSPVPAAVFVRPVAREAAGADTSGEAAPLAGTGLTGAGGTVSADGAAGANPARRDVPAVETAEDGSIVTGAEELEELEEIPAEKPPDEAVTGQESPDRTTPFVPREFLAILNKNSVGDLKLGDHIKQEMTIFFSDIRQFTDLSERLTPEESFAFINSYLSRIVPKITMNGGFVDKYIGDAILALFPQIDGPDMAVRAAISIQECIQEYNVHRASCGYRPLSMGIGLHTGTLMMGVVGVKDRMQNTVISDAVNLASRLESITKVFGVSLAISEETFKKLADPGSYKYRFIGKVRVKGKSAPVSIFEIFDGINPATQERKIKANMFFEEGMFHYYQKQYSEALMNFRRVREVLPDDGASAFYMDACLSKIKAL
ncbi:MAG: adenylate/guanylate cyclase domain-containing protein [Treponema sp.]|jgi:two-component system sensor histidine kinase ChiS|nr:adenylate/guanylate cyclase domain-containing protein [Treponema sp.]